jgi:exopolyphosphatase/guanosine-5'-triphosphate,3'-diphosphate pyrophosphatase
MMMREIPWRDYHPARVHLCEIRKSKLAHLCRNLAAMDLSARQRVTGLEPSRADIVVPGICVIEVLLDCLGLDAYIHGETDILWAVCSSAAAEEGLETDVAVF